MTTLSVDEAVADWKIHLQAENKSPKTIKIYTDAANRLTKVDSPSRDLKKILAELSARCSASYVSQHYRSWQQFYKWLVEEDIVDTNPFDKMKPPKVPQVPVPVLPDPDLKKLLASCSARTFEAKETRPSSGCLSTQDSEPRSSWG
jgi:site-specific recombinase XerD